MNNQTAIAAQIDALQGKIDCLQTQNEIIKARVSSLNKLFHDKNRRSVRSSIIEHVEVLKGKFDNNVTLIARSETSIRALSKLVHNEGEIFVGGYVFNENELEAA